MAGWELFSRYLPACAGTLNCRTGPTYDDRRTHFAADFVCRCYPADFTVTLAEPQAVWRIVHTANLARPHAAAALSRGIQALLNIEVEKLQNIGSIGRHPDAILVGCASLNLDRRAKKRLLAIEALRLAIRRRQQCHCSREPECDDAHDFTPHGDSVLRSDN